MPEPLSLREVLRRLRQELLQSTEPQLSLINVTATWANNGQGPSWTIPPFDGPITPEHLRPAQQPGWAAPGTVSPAAADSVQIGRAHV